MMGDSSVTWLARLWFFKVTVFVSNFTDVIVTVKIIFSTGSLILFCSVHRPTVLVDAILLHLMEAFKF